MRQITKRLLPGQDFKKEIESLAQEYAIDAGCVVSMVGSLKKATLRVADGKTVKSWNKRLEITGGTGTVSRSGCHIHVTLADEKGNAFGGHLKEDCIINTTAEIVLLVFENSQYERIFDKQTGYDELHIA